MGLGLLAPVPCVHLRPALATCEAEGRVAFASDAIDLFLGLKAEGILKGLPVLIYASRPEYGEAGLSIDPFASFTATLVCWQRANDQGKHPNASVRPVSTGDDSPVLGFWEVSDLRQLDEAVPLRNLRARGSKSNFRSGYVPHGPVVVEAAVL